MPAGKPVFHVGVQSYCFRHFDLDGAIRRTRELGLKYIECFPKHASHDWPPDKVEEAKMKITQAGLHQNAYGVVPFTKDEAACRKVFDFARTMGTKVITCDPAPDSFDVLDKLVAEYDLCAAIHNHGPGHRYGKGQTILDAIKDHDPRIGLCLDTGHCLRSDESPVDVIHRLGKRVLAVHVKDVNEKGEDVIFGTARLDLGGVIRALHDIGFSGPMSMENESMPEDPVPNLRAGLEAIQREIAKL